MKRATNAGRSAQRFGTVLFDCDSTLSSIEGIEELAFVHRAEITLLTEAAMRGDVALEDVFARRLELVRPSRADVAALGDRYIQTLVPDAKALVTALLSEGIIVRVISGGLYPAVLMLAHSLGLSDDSVAAVDVFFDEAGVYTGFDRASPLARSGGKRVQVERWLPLLTRPIMFVGDGITDLEARPPADFFVAYTGVAHRPEVAAGADAVVKSRSLAPVLSLALGGVPPADTKIRALFDRGTSLMTGASNTPH
ncbi:MAG: HAD-IB family phosphatase [Anaerolineae bacterium]|nr:HAD-IB family phosphatase [Gemmatimonadaceae bacterium]